MKYESTLPIALTIILSIILVILLIVRIVQSCQQWRLYRFIKKSKSKKLSEEDGEEGHDEIIRSTSAVTAKQERKFNLCKKQRKQEAQIDAPVVPFTENGSLLQSGIRVHPTRKAENKSWYDSKVIPFIDEAGASLDNLYLPEKVIYEVA